MDRSVENAKALRGTNYRSTFEEIFDRGRFNVAQFARDFLDIELHEGQQRWMDSSPWADERFLASGNRWGKCIARGSLIPLYDGQRVPIEDIEIGDMAWGLREDYQLRPVRVRDKICSGVKETYRVTTASGRQVDVTEEHPFRTIDGWVNVDELLPGDYIAVPRGYDSPSVLPPSNDNEAIILGYLISDGTLTSMTPFFTNKNKRVVNDLERAIMSIPRFEGVTVNPLKDGPISYSISAGHQGGAPNPVTTWLKELGIYGCDAYSKHVPACVFEWDDPAIETFLNRLFAGDGWASVDNQGGCQIGYSTASKQLAHDIQHLLLRLEIRSDIRTKYPKYHNGEKQHYVVSITSKDELENFILGVDIYSKEEDTRKIIQILSLRSNSRDKDIVPGMQERIREYQSQVSYDTSEWELCRGARGKTIRRYKLGEIARAFDDREMFHLAYSGVLWDKIKSITPVGEQEVWDLSVDPHHNFVANDIIVHNTYSAAVKLLHHCLYQSRHFKYAEMTDRYIAINLSITLDMANIAWDFAFIRALDSPLYRRFVIESECRRTPFPTMVIGSGGKGRGSWRSEFWARSTSKRGKYLLGKDFDFVNYDEAARDPDGPAVRDDVLLMRLADRNGRIDYTSTGNFKNWYYQEFTRSLEAFRDDPESSHLYAQSGSSYENHHISHEKLKRNEARLGEMYTLQNIYGGFASTAVVFQPSDVERCYRDQDYPIPVAPDKKKGLYVMGIDWGRKQDQTVILVARIDRRPAQLVYAKAMGGTGHEVTWDEIYKEVNKTHRTYNNAFMLVDSTSQAGDLHMETLRNNYSIEHVQGYNFAGGGSSKKMDLITAGQHALQGRWIVFPYIAEMYDQLVFYDYDDRKLATDWVMAFCLLAMAYQKETWTDRTVHESILVIDSTNEVPGAVEVPVGPWERLANDHYGGMSGKEAVAG